MPGGNAEALLPRTGGWQDIRYVGYLVFGDVRVYMDNQRATHIAGCVPALADELVVVKTQEVVC